ncbi:hypothetical protein [Tenacibaculum caenipelagi]|uniref:Oligosaccharide repeat unit polymerase n=1 Tax=Tenacibaculum caenipelagi TaxID=1325435 RepID=A0A4R6TC90_9FLAO|nr:hypothetical protein [Tenacibaculum caenipelagi]TDQ24099.1 hypothetical protein DFQ07_2644 [Tenacibaculum caenipelagi]
MITLIEKILYPVILALILLLVEDLILESKILVCFLLFLNVRLIYNYRKVIPVFILFIFTSTYIIPYYYHFFLDYEVSFHSSFNNSFYLNKTLVIFSVFLVSVLGFTDKVTNYVYPKKRLKHISSDKFFYFFLTLAFLLGIMGLTGENMLGGSAYGSIEENRSPLFEYSLIFFIISSLFFDNKLIKKIMIAVFVSYMVIKDLIYGGRITSIMLLLLVYILFFEDIIKKKKVYITLVLGFLFMSVFSFIRSNPDLLLNGEVSFSDLYNHLVETNSNKRLVSNQGDVAQSSSRLMGFVTSGIISFDDRLESFIGFVISIFIPGYDYSDLTNLAGYKKESYTAGGGGLFPVYFYVWFSYLGVVFSGYLIAKIIHMFVSSTKNWVLLFSILVLVSFPRWFAYSPIIIFKMCGYVIPIYLVFKKIKKA